MLHITFISLINDVMKHPLASPYSIFSLFTLLVKHGAQWFVNNDIMIKPRGIS